MSAVVIIGSFNVDHVWQCDTLPAAGATIAGRYNTGPGGKGFNQAMASARTGATTAFVCALGDDPGGALARALCDDNAIELRAQRSDDLTGTAGIYVDARGRNTIIVGAGANAALAPEFVAQQQVLIGASKVVLAQLESPVESVLAALRIAREQGACTLLNPAPTNASTTIELLSLVDILTPNETEFSALLARHVGERIEPDDVSSCDGARLHAACRELLREGSVVVTLGSAGAFVSHPDSSVHDEGKSYYRIAAEPVSTVDSTGAGDAFNGALAASWAMQPELAFADHLRFATRYAALSTEHNGTALAMPRRAEVMARFADRAAG